MNSQLPLGTDSSVLNLYEKREKIFARRIEGFYQNIRLFTGWPLLIGYFGLPWLVIDGRQSILFDLAERKFHIFFLTFWPQDFSLLAAVLVTAAFALFFVTTLLGRVWCGYTCPQTVWTAIFMWAEQLAEGDRHQRIKLSSQLWSWRKLRRTGFKHFLWLGFAALTGVTFVSYFYDMRALFVDAYHLDIPLVAVFWISLFTVGTYINAGWMREQVCIYMCPYARFQSAMLDKDTLIVSYDKQRGDPRGSRKRLARIPVVSIVEPLAASENLREKENKKGDCIDCQLCVQVCPTGIDIRDGLQYECINCALCVDACNSIMDKMGYERGLVRYTTEHLLDGHAWTWKRPKLIGYGLALCVVVTLVTIVLLTRIPLELDVLRSRGQLYQEVRGGDIQNIYTLKVINMDDQSHRYLVSVEGLPEFRLSPTAEFYVTAGEVGEFAIDVVVNPDLLTQVNTPIVFRAQTIDGRHVVSSNNTFIGPRPLDE